ncbi:MAG: AI-2E family transporter, partial [Cyclobacteriaceae bacterium]|nr:AI-2E family transporter [Cyclobacteriaceae bacterium]
ASIQKQLAAIDIQAYLSRFVGALTSFLGDFVIVWIYVIFLLIEETVFSRKMHLIFSIPERFNEIQELSSRMGRAVHAYLSVKTLTSLLTGLLGYALLVVLNVDFPELWAFLIFLLNFIPYLGSLVATLLPAVFAIFQFNSWIYFVWVFGAILAAQILVANFIEPRVMGRQLNLSPLVVILSLTFWGMIWGILGMVIAIPITSIAMIMLAQFDSTKYLAMLLSESGKIDHLTENK